MKLGVSYIVFDGIELLELSIRQIRAHVDYINVIYQEVSWTGKRLSREDSLILHRLRELGLINELILFSTFTPILIKKKKEISQLKDYERAKRQVGLRACLSNGCTHYLGMDVDEFYVTDEFVAAKEQIINHDYDSTAVKFINYVSIPILHRGLDESHVPFICKIYSDSKLSRSFFVHCDPTRGVANGSKKNHKFSHSSIMMHHMETVRKNLLSKYESTTRKFFDRTQTKRLVNLIKSAHENTTSFNFNKIIFPKAGNFTLVKSPNLFKIPYTTWKK